MTYSNANPAFKAGAVTIFATSSKTLPAVPTISIDQQGTTDIVAVNMVGSVPGTVFTYSYTVTAATGGTYKDGLATVSITGTDAVGNVGTQVTSGGTFYTDTTAPVVTGLSTTARNAPYKAGDSIDITVTFSEPLATVTTAATLPILVPAAVNATYQAAKSDPASGKLVFSYTFLAAQGTSNLNNSTPIGTGTGITDLAANAATLTLPTTGGTELASNPGGIVVDAIAPTVLNVTGTSGTYGVGQEVSVLVKFSEPVTVVRPSVPSFTGSISGTTLTVSGSSPPTLAVGQVISITDCP